MVPILWTTQGAAYHGGDGCQGHFASHLRVVVQEHRCAPLLNGSGPVIIRQVIERLGMGQAINTDVRLLKRHEPYAELDHIFTLEVLAKLLRQPGFVIGLPVEADRG